MPEVDEAGKPLLLTVLQDEELPDTLYHYTGLRGLRGIIESRRLWASHIRYLNDVDEFRLGFRIARKLMTDGPSALPPSIGPLVLQSLNEVESFRVFVASFTNDGGDRLSQWRGYCYGAPGFGVGLSRNVLKMQSVAMNGLLVVVRSCIYDTVSFEEQLNSLSQMLIEGAHNKSSQIVANITANFAFGTAVQAARLKHHGFKEEQEWRVIGIELAPGRMPMERVQFHEGKSSQVPHIELPLATPEDLLTFDRITVGPSPLTRTDAIGSVHLLLQRFDAQCGEVNASEIPFRYW